MNQESRQTSQNAQTPSHFGEYQDSLKHAAQLYKQYCQRVLEGLDAVITKNNHSAASYAGRQVIMVRSV